VIDRRRSGRTDGAPAMGHHGGVIGGGKPRIGAVLRSDDRVLPLELFFDLVFVLAFTQCSALMAHEPTWRSVAQAMLVLAVFWWSWVGYAWLTSVVDPEEGAVRLALFVAMAGLLVAALCIPEAFGDLALTLAIAYGVVRASHIALFVLASRDDPDLRSSVLGLAVSTALGVGLLVAASFADNGVQAGLWVAAVALDMGGPLLIPTDGWRLEPHHFAERHGLVVLIALGESIVALGVGSTAGVDGGVIVAAVLGIALTAAMWWAYFDVGALMAARELASRPPGREQNELARDAYSYLHLPMVAGIVLLALGLESTLAHVHDELQTVPAWALGGGLAAYFLALVAFKWRATGRRSTSRLVAAFAAVALVPLAEHVEALVTLGLAAAVAWALIVFETIRYAATRDHVRHHPDDEHPEHDHH
jgi:low temperature requirement protein LtrA